MTKKAKWAFSSKDTAAAFIKEHGGSQTGFEEAVKTAYEDMYTDTRMIRDKRRMMKMKKTAPDKSHGHSH